MGVLMRILQGFARFRHFLHFRLTSLEPAFQTKDRYTQISARRAAAGGNCGRASSNPPGSWRED